MSVSATSGVGGTDEEHGNDTNAEIEAEESAVDPGGVGCSDEEPWSDTDAEIELPWEAAECSGEPRSLA